MEINGWMDGWMDGCMDGLEMFAPKLKTTRAKSFALGFWSPRVPERRPRDSPTVAYACSRNDPRDFRVLQGRPRVSTKIN